MVFEHHHGLRVRWGVSARSLRCFVIPRVGLQCHANPRTLLRRRFTCIDALMLTCRPTGTREPIVLFFGVRLHPTPASTQASSPGMCRCVGGSPRDARLRAALGESSCWEACLKAVSSLRCILDMQVVNVSGLAAGSHFVLQFEDFLGRKSNTYPVPRSAPAAQLQLALQALPNAAIPSVTVTREANSDLFRVTFDDPATLGEQALLACNPPELQNLCDSGYAEVPDCLLYETAAAYVVCVLREVHAFLRCFSDTRPSSSWTPARASPTTTARPSQAPTHTTQMQSTWSCSSARGKGSATTKTAPAVVLLGKSLSRYMCDTSRCHLIVHGLMARCVVPCKGTKGLAARRLQKCICKCGSDALQHSLTH